MDPKNKKPKPAEDEMFPEGSNTDLVESGSSSIVLTNLPRYLKLVHADFYNDFGDIFDDDDDIPVASND